MRISDCSSDVCSSDLHTRGPLTLLPFETCFECSYFISHYDTPQTRGKHSQISAYENVGRFLRLQRGHGATRLSVRTGHNGSISQGSWEDPDQERRTCRSGRCWSAKRRSEEHTSELQSLMRISYAVFCLTQKTQCHLLIFFLYSSFVI